MQTNLPETGFLRLPQIVGQTEVTPKQAEANRKEGVNPKRPREYIPAIIPISKSTWWAGVKEGRYPKPVKLSGGITVWRAEDIRALLESANSGVAA